MHPGKVLYNMRYGGQLTVRHKIKIKPILNLNQVEWYLAKEIKQIV